MAEIIPEEVTALQRKGKELFNKGEVQAAFKVFEEEMLKTATDSGNAAAILQSHIVLARHRMETGNYPAANKSLDQILTALTDFGEDKLKEAKNLFYTKLACKYYQIASKNKMRAYFYEFSKDIVEGGIALVSVIQGHDDLRDKFLAKLYENYTSLMCEPLYFTKGEEYLDKAEEIYKKNLNLNRSLYQKFKLKKAAFLKKYGFFNKSLDYLNEL